MKIMSRIQLLFLGVLIYFNVSSQEISQWRGENRDGIYNDKGLLKKWGENGPELLWHYDELGDGFSSAAVTKNAIYLTGLKDGKGYIYAISHEGKLLWKTEYGPEWTDAHSGTRTTPLVYGEQLYLLGGLGTVYCMAAKTGKIIWSVDLFKDYDGRQIKWAITENLLIDGNKLFCTAGGIKANVIALDKNTGKLIWKSKGSGEMSAYCSPALIKLPNRHIFVTMTDSSIVGIDAADGKFLWKHEHTNKYGIQPNTPIYINGYLYCLSGTGSGGLMLKLSEDGNKITEVWSNTSLDTKLGNVVVLNGRIYGAGDKIKKLQCIDWLTGKDLFSADMIAPANIISADGLLYCYSESGTVSLVEPKSDKFELLSSFKVPYGSNEHWAYLVINDKKLYIRHGNSLMVYELGIN